MQPKQSCFEGHTLHGHHRLRRNELDDLDEFYELDELCSMVSDDTSDIERLCKGRGDMGRVLISLWLALRELPKGKDNIESVVR